MAHLPPAVSRTFTGQMTARRVGVAVLARPEGFEPPTC